MSRPISHMDPHYRAHPKRYSKTNEVVLSSGVNSYNLPNDEFLNDKDIIGILVRRGGSSRKSKTGRTLAGDAVLNATFFSIINNNNLLLDSYPLENMVADTSKIGPGQYDQLCLPPGVKLSNCKIEIPVGVTITSNEVLEFTFIYMMDDNC